MTTETLQALRELSDISESVASISRAVANVTTEVSCQAVLLQEILLKISCIEQTLAIANTAPTSRLLAEGAVNAAYRNLTPGKFCDRLKEEMEKINGG